MDKEIKDIKLTDKEYIAKLENAIDDLNTYTNNLQAKLQQKDNAIDECIEYCKEKVNEVKIGGCDILTDKMFETEKRCYKDLLEKLQQAKEVSKDE